MTEQQPSVTKTVLIRESAPRPQSGGEPDQLVRVIGAVVIRNPFLGTSNEDSSRFDPMGEVIGRMIIQDMLNLLPSAPCSYGKATLIGQLGTPEHGAALMHPTLGRPIRDAIGGGKAIIPSNVKLGAIGATVDVPLSHKDDAWSFDYLDTIPVCIPDAPRPDEIVVIIALSTGKRTGA